MTSRALVLLLAGSLQSWGVRGSFPDYRDTAEHPTRSGVLGFLGCTLGRPRGSAPDDLAELDLTVRIDRPGRVLEDYHTIGGQTREEVVPSADGSRRAGAVITRRAYLADAAFTIALTGPDPLLHTLEHALDHPAYAPYLGRRACPPAAPYNLGIHDGTPASILATAPLDRPKPTGADHVTADIITTVAHDDPDRTHTLDDDPHGQRRFTQRNLSRTTIRLPADKCAGNDAAKRYETLHDYRYGTTT
jgi:CRISPR system Cascade subunit CasD